MPHSGSAILSPLVTLQRGTLTSDLSLTCGPTTLADTSKPISSPVSADGPTPCGSPDGPMIDRSGPAPVRVSRFRARDNARAMPTNDTSGPLFTASSPSARLQSSLENRLRARMDVNGSPEFALTWKHWDLPAGPPICALRASARPISVNGSIGVPTPVVPNGGRRPKGGAMSLKGQTPDGKKRQVDLDFFVRRALAHPTPMHGAQNEAAHNAMSGQWKTAIGRMSNGSRLATKGSSALNPAYPCWLMGFPDVWDGFAGTATRLSRKSRPSS